MDAFVPKMKKKYIDRLINREKQWPPCHSNKLVRLQLVERKIGEGYCANIQRGREDETVKRTPLAYSDLFKVERGKKPVRKVLVEGDAGIGKTTLSISLSEDWAHEKLFEEFELLLLLPLRHKKVASAGSLPELLKLLHPSSDICKAVASYVENEEEKVLIIADGWDELSDSHQQEGSLLYELLFETFPLMSVVVTSRPSASAPLHRLPCIDRFVEISGFSKEDIKEYIESEFTSDQEKASRLLEQLEDNPLVESVCSIPLNCSIMCHLWRTLEEGLPSTMTQLYKKIVLNVILRNIQKKDAYKNVFSLPHFKALPSDLQQSFRLLCEFAFQSLQKNQIVFSQEELVEFFPEGLALDEKILCFGLLQSAETVLETGHGLSFHFIHLTFMEYLAALHLLEQTQCNCTKQQLTHSECTLSKILPKMFNNLCVTSCFDMVWRFFFGFIFHHSEVETYHYDHVILVLMYMKHPRIFLSLCHCAFEAQNTDITSKVIQLTSECYKYVDIADACATECISKHINNYDGHTAHDCDALLYIIDNMEKCDGMKIDFSYSGVRDLQIRRLTDILTRKQGMLEVKWLNLSGNRLTDTYMSEHFHRASPEPKSDALTLAKSVPSRCGSSELGMSNYSPGVHGLQILVNAIRGNLFSRLEGLYLNGCLTSDADTNGKLLTPLMDALSNCCPCLNNLGLYQNNLGIAGASALGRGLSILQCHSSNAGQLWLQLNDINLGDDGLKAFVHNINCKEECKFKVYYLKLSDNNIHAAGVSYLADAVCSGKITFCTDSKVAEFKLNNNPLGLECVESVARILSSKNFKTFGVDLDRCKLTTSGGGLPNIDSLKFSDSISSESVLHVGKLLCSMAHTCKSTILWLHLDGNCFTGEGIHILAGLMHLCSSLKFLFCSDCGITSDDLILLLDRLTQLKSSSPSLCSELGTWYLDNNAIDDRGVSYLISHLSSLFPSMDSNNFQGFSVDSNKVSKEMKSYIESQSKGVEESMSHRSSTSEDRTSFQVYPEREEEPLSTPHPPPTPVTDSLTRQHVCGDQQESCSDEESLDLRPPALKKPKYEGTFILVTSKIRPLKDNY